MLLAWREEEQKGVRFSDRISSMNLHLPTGFKDATKLAAMDVVTSTLDVSKADKVRRGFAAGSEGAPCMGCGTDGDGGGGEATSF